jgi:hypothetical protein
MEPDRNFMALMYVQSLPTAWRTRGVWVIAQTVGGSEYACGSTFRVSKNHGLVFLPHYVIFIP